MNATEPSPESALSRQVGGSHYKGLAIQPAEYCQRNRLPYCEAAVVGYVTRHREKGGRLDIEKAIHCLQMLLEMEYPESAMEDIPPTKQKWCRHCATLGDHFAKDCPLFPNYCAP